MRSQNVRVKDDVAVPLAELAKEKGMTTAEYLDKVIRTHLGLHTTTNVFHAGEIIDGQHRLWKYLCYCADYTCSTGRYKYHLEYIKVIFK